MDKLPNAMIRELKGRAQRMDAAMKVGREGLSPAFLGAVDQFLEHHELLKIRFEEFKEQKDELALQLAEKTHSHLVTRLGNVAVLYRARPKDAEV